MSASRQRSEPGACRALTSSPCSSSRRARPAPRKPLAPVTRLRRAKLAGGGARVELGVTEALDVGAGAQRDLVTLGIRELGRGRAVGRGRGRPDRAPGVDLPERLP